MKLNNSKSELEKRQSFGTYLILAWVSELDLQPGKGQGKLIIKSVTVLYFKKAITVH